MGSQHSKSQTTTPAKQRPVAASSVKPPESKPVDSQPVDPCETEHLQLSSSFASSISDPQGDDSESSKPKLIPSKLKRFRVKVPQSMVPGDIMTIKLNGIMTKILISTPTTSTEKTQVPKADPSRAGTSCSETSSSSITPPPSPIDAVVASTDAQVPEGKMIVEAKPVIVVHAVFEYGKECKDQMVDEAMRQIIQETVNCGCNALLGMTVSIKKQAENMDYLIKACGTPCLLIPTQVHLSKTTTTPSGMPVRKRTSSAELPPTSMPVRRQ